MKNKLVVVGSITAGIILFLVMQIHNQGKLTVFDVIGVVGGWIISVGVCVAAHQYEKKKAERKDKNGLD